MVTSPDQARSQSASWSSSTGRSRSASRSSQKPGPGGEPLADRVVGLALDPLQLRVGGRRAGEADVLAEVEGDAAVVAAAGAGADPDHLAAGAELVEPGRRVGAETPRQHVLLPDLRRQRDALQGHQRLAQAVGAGAGGAVGVDVLPARQEAGEAIARGGLDLAPQVGQAGPAHAAQHVGVAPLALAAAGQQLAADEDAGALELAQRRGRVDPVAPGRLRGRERAVGARVAPDQRHAVGSSSASRKLSGRPGGGGTPIASR